MLCTGTGWFTVRAIWVSDSQKATQTWVKKEVSHPVPSRHNAYDRPRWTSVNLGPSKSGYSISRLRHVPMYGHSKGDISAISLLMRRPALLLNDAPLYCGGK